MSDLGERLRLAREDRGTSLREVATTTKISVTALEAIERGDFGRLPGGIFSRAFVRAYAVQVGLDPERTVEEFRVEFEAYERAHARTVVRPEVTDDDRAFLEQQRRAALVLRSAVIVLAALLVLWLIAWRAGMFAGPAAPVDSTPSAPARAELPPPPPPADPPPPTPPAATRFNVEFTISAPCWARITVDGTVAVERVLGAGERQTLTVARELAIEVGNAGAFAWTIDGRPARTLGNAGEVGRATVTRDTMASFLRAPGEEG